MWGDFPRRRPPAAPHSLEASRGLVVTPTLRQTLGKHPGDSAHDVEVRRALGVLVRRAELDAPFCIHDAGIRREMAFNLLCHVCLKSSPSSAPNGFGRFPVQDTVVLNMGCAMLHVCLHRRKHEPGDLACTPTFAQIGPTVRLRLTLADSWPKLATVGPTRIEGQDEHVRIRPSSARLWPMRGRIRPITTMSARIDLIWPEIYQTRLRSNFGLHWPISTNIYWPGRGRLWSAFNQTRPDVGQFRPEIV